MPQVSVSFPASFGLTGGSAYSAAAARRQANNIANAPATQNNSVGMKKVMGGPYSHRRWNHDSGPLITFGRVIGRFGST